MGKGGAGKIIPTDRDKGEQWLGDLGGGFSASSGNQRERGRRLVSRCSCQGGVSIGNSKKKSGVERAGSTEKETRSAATTKKDHHA